MNIEKLKLLQMQFLSQYKEGFNSEEFSSMAKKHNLQGNVDYIHKVCNKERFESGLANFEDIVKVVTKSSMVSVFEKMRFRDLMKEFDEFQKHELLDAIYENLHGDEQQGFERLVDLLSIYKLAKWPIITVWRAYFNPYYDVFIKPTTVKKILKHLEIEDIKYSPKANFEFYTRYRDYILEMKKNVDERLQTNNPAFSGFLMITIP